MIGLVIAAVGAILLWAVHINTTAVDIHTIGVILLIVGGIAALLEIIFWNYTWGRFRHTERRIYRDWRD